MQIIALGGKVGILNIAAISFEINKEFFFTVVCSRCRLNLGFANFTLSFGRLRQRIVFKCVPHVQHDCFSSFNQSDHCFLASSLPLASTLLIFGSRIVIKLRDLDLSDNKGKRWNDCVQEFCHLQYR